MVTFADRIRRKWLQKGSGTKGRNVKVLLDAESLQRLERLKGELHKASDGELIATALRVLENTRDEVIKRQIIKKIQCLHDAGDPSPTPRDQGKTAHVRGNRRR